MSGQLSLSESQLSDFRAIVKLTEAQLGALHKRLGDLVPVPMSRKEIRRAITEVLPDAPEQVEAVTRQALALAGLQYRYDIPQDELANVLRESLGGKLSPSQMEAWGRIAPIFLDILASRAIRTTVKSVDLRYDYANLVQSSNVIIDLRPVFDDGADHAIGAIVSFTLRLSYQNGDNTHSLSLAMDAEDVGRLQEQCRRAMKKAESARTEFSGPNGSVSRVEISGKLER